MLFSYWIVESEHRAWEREFNVRAARGDFVRHSFPAPVRGRRFHVFASLKRIRLALRVPERLLRQA